MKKRNGRAVYLVATIISSLMLSNVYGSHAGKTNPSVRWLAMPDDGKKLYLTGFEHGLITAYVDSHTSSQEMIAKFVPQSDGEAAVKFVGEFVVYGGDPSSRVPIECGVGELCG